MQGMLSLLLFAGAVHVDLSELKAYRWQVGSSFWPYYARAHGSWPIPPGSAITVPTAYCQFPFEILRPPRSLAARTYTNITRWTVMEQGGHFAAMEQPDALASDIRTFFSTVR